MSILIVPLFLGQAPKYHSLWSVQGIYWTLYQHKLFDLSLAANTSLSCQVSGEQWEICPIVVKGLTIAVYKYLGTTVYGLLAHVSAGAP